MAADFMAARDQQSGAPELEWPGSHTAKLEKTKLLVQCSDMKPVSWIYIYFPRFFQPFSDQTGHNGQNQRQRHSFQD